MRCFLALVFLLGSILTKGQSPTVAFTKGDWAGTLAQAKKANKAVFLYAGSPSCHFCRPMETEVFPTPAVSRYYNATFLSHKINVDEGEGKVLAERFAIRTLPAYLYFSPQGKLLHLSSGYEPAADFVVDGRDAFNPKKAFFSLKEQYQAGDRTAELLYALSTAPALAQEPALYDQVTGEYLKSQQPKDLASQKNTDFIFNAYADFGSPLTQYFLTHQSAMVAQFGQEAVTKKVKGTISREAGELGQKNDLAALSNLQQAVGRLVPDGAAQWQALARVHYLLGQPQRDWPAYADAVLAYGAKYAGQDSYTLYEATVYMTAFVEDRAVLAKADPIIRQALAADRSYLHLLTRAKLLRKLGDNEQAASVANEAVAAAAKANKGADDAVELLAEIKR
ncbi:thioredoxin family protein [uncultured Hymenobacter sp.]|uniref:thioredoxin family protein n=1 Tax=uncultured Hymenobacter sp. TaxID=170016 RepID=UPI0035CC1D22